MNNRLRNHDFIWALLFIASFGLLFSVKPSSESSGSLWSALLPESLSWLSWLPGLPLARPTIDLPHLLLPSAVAYALFVVYSFLLKYFASVTVVSTMLAFPLIIFTVLFSIAHVSNIFSSQTELALVAVAVSICAMYAFWSYKSLVLASASLSLGSSVVTSFLSIPLFQFVLLLLWTVWTRYIGLLSFLSMLHLIFVTVSVILLFHQ